MSNHLQHLMDADSYLNKKLPVEAAKYYAVFIQQENQTGQPEKRLLARAYEGLDRALDGVVAKLVGENRIAESTLVTALKEVVKQNRPEQALHQNHNI